MYEDPITPLGTDYAQFRALGKYGAKSGMLLTVQNSHHHRRFRDSAQSMDPIIYVLVVLAIVFLAMKIRDSIQGSPSPPWDGVPNAASGNHVYRPEFILQSGDRYTGYWRVVNGVCVERDGAGTCIYVKGGSYQGDWKHDKRHGYGVRKWPSGDVYEGEWKNNKMEGKGKYVYANGTRYEGHFKENKYSGFGELTYPDGGKYSGQWLNGMKEGQATNTWANGGSYQGSYVKDHRCGYGVMRYATGGTYAGNWTADMRHGYGVSTNPDGTTVAGMWDNDKPVGVVGGGVFQGG